MNVIICGVVKNAGPQLKNNIDLAIQLGLKCDSYKIVIYENNSTDNVTKTILSTYMKDPHCKIIMEDIPYDVIKKESKIWAYTAVTGSDHPCRIEQIANARNKLIEEIKQEAYAEFNYVVMIDFDAKFFLIDGILSSLELVKKDRKNVIYANSPEYYDYYALRSSHSVFNLFGPELAGEHFWKTMNMFRLQVKHSDCLLSVYSAFNGIGVYDKEAFTKHTFSAFITPTVKDVYRTLALQHPVLYEQNKEHIQSECSKFKGGELDTGNDGIFYWKNNSGYDKPVICEHVALNFALINDGYTLYINPKMLYWW